MSEPSRQDIEQVEARDETSPLLGQGLVDEVVLSVYPVLLGRGKRFFSDSVDARELAFVGTKSTPTGVLVNTYRYVGSLRT